MDICTLVAITIVTTATCKIPDTCVMDEGRVFCTQNGYGSCPQPAPHYVCTRPDKTTYKLKFDRKTVID